MTRDFPGASYDNWKQTDPADAAPENEGTVTYGTGAAGAYQRQVPTAEDLAAIVVIDQSPMPMACADFVATRGDWDLGNAIGHGATPEEAIISLLEHEELMRDD